MKLDQLRALSAVAHCGSFQAAARTLNKSHPAVITAIRNLEMEFSIDLIERSQYRACLSSTGRSFNEKAQSILSAVDDLIAHGKKLAGDYETELNVVIGDITPVQEILVLLKQFFKNHPHTKLNLHFESLSGPLDLLINGKADLIFHTAPKAWTQLTCHELMTVYIIPVAAPDFLDFAVHDSITFQDMQPYVQCIIRDSATKLDKKSYFVVKNAPKMTVGDQVTKKQIILQGMGWGHMPNFMVDQELADGRLIDISGSTLKTNREIISAIRRTDVPSGPVADQLWQHIGRQ